MKRRFAVSLMLLVILSLIASIALVGCGGDEEEATEAPAAAATKPPPPPEADKVVNRAGVELPADAAPIEEQVLNLGATEYSWLGWDYTAYDFTGGPTYGIHDSCVRPDKEFQPHALRLRKLGGL